jgi:hypothetical protein
MELYIYQGVRWKCNISGSGEIIEMLLSFFLGKIANS